MQNRLDRPYAPPADRWAARAQLIGGLADDLAFIRNIIRIERRSEGKRKPPTYGTRHPRPVGFCSWHTHRYLIRWHDAYTAAQPTLDERAFILLRR